MFGIRALPSLAQGVYYMLSTEAGSVDRASPGGVPRAGDDLVVIQEAAAGQVTWKTDPDNDPNLQEPLSMIVLTETRGQDGEDPAYGPIARVHTAGRARAGLGWSGPSDEGGRDTVPTGHWSYHTWAHALLWCPCLLPLLS